MAGHKSPVDTLDNLSDAVHLLEYFLTLALDFQAHGVTQFAKIALYLVEGGGGVGQIYNHHHIEITAYDGLRNVEDIGFMFCQIGTYTGNNTFIVFSYYSNDYLIHNILVLKIKNLFYLISDWIL